MSSLSRPNIKLLHPRCWVNKQSLGKSPAQRGQVFTVYNSLDRDRVQKLEI